MAKFSIFYSWQSDLPGNITRNFIRSCIDRAIGVAYDIDAIEAERDESTLGLTGSPDIVASIFSKIDDCDMFVADLSLCFTEDKQGIKHSPNPNVLLELGYAVKVLGWERVICLINTEFGEEYPFDLAHNRITPFSINEDNKSDEKKRITKIIADNISALQNEHPKAKNGMASFVIGSYDFSSHSFVDKLIPFDIMHSESFVLHNEELLDEAKTLVEEINNLSCCSDNSKTELTEKSNLDFDKNGDTWLSDVEIPRQAITLLADSYKILEDIVVWEDVDEDIERIKRLLNIEVQKSFFDLGNLKKTVQILNRGKTIYNGTKDEELKFDKLHLLSLKLLQVDVRNEYIQTFSDMFYLPVAIKNTSKKYDEDISVYLQIDTGTSIIPDNSLICEELEGLQGSICRDDDDENDVGIICELFCLEENDYIHIEDDGFSIPDCSPRIPVFTQNGYQLSEKTEKDYGNELREFIAVPVRENHYEFEISSLRPGECKWLSKGILIRPDNGIVNISYRIHSKYTDGNVAGNIRNS